MTIARTISAGAGHDPYWDKVVLLLHCDGSNGGTTFTDSSSKAHTQTRAYVTTSTGQVKFGTAAAYYNDTSKFGYIKTDSSADFSMGSGDYTWEMFGYFVTTNSGGTALLDARVTSPVADGVLMYLDTSDKLTYFRITNSATYTFGASSAITKNQWLHLAMTRSSNTVRLFVDGKKVGEGTDSQSSTGNRPAYMFGDAYGSAMTGEWYTDDLRITKGVARYTADFTAPSRPFPNG